MSSYRINVRFDLDDECQREAAEYLRGLDGSRNKFIVEAILKRIDSNEDAMFERFRQMLREEIGDIRIAASPEKAPAILDISMTAEDEAANAESVLDDLELFA